MARGHYQARMSNEERDVKTFEDFIIFMAYAISECLVDHHNERHLSKERAIDVDLKHTKLMQTAIFNNTWGEAPELRNVLEMFWQMMSRKMMEGNYKVLLVFVYTVHWMHMPICCACVQELRERNAEKDLHEAESFVYDLLNERLEEFEIAQIDKYFASR